MQTVQSLRVVVAGPGDVRAECEQVRSVVEDLNRGVAAILRLRLEYHNWRQDSYPGMHPFGPQGIVDRVLQIPNADLVIALFWKRFGTAIPSGETGTEHEIVETYTRWRAAGKPELMLYFNKAPITPDSEEELDQYRGVLKFRKELPKRFAEVFAGEYSGKDEFAGEIRRALENWLKDKYARDEPGIEADPRRRSIYIASVASDLKNEREALLREVEAQGWAALPGKDGLPTADESALRDKIAESIGRGEITVHLAGQRYWPIAELEAGVAERAGSKRFLWVHPEASSTGDARQKEFLQTFAADPLLRGFRRWEVPFEEFRQDLIKQLKRKPEIAPGVANAYLVYHPDDGEEAARLSRDLYDLRLEVVEPPDLGAGFLESHREIWSAAAALCFIGGAPKPTGSGRCTAP